MNKDFIRCDLLKPSSYDPRRTGLTKARIETIRDQFNTPALLLNEDGIDISRLVRSAGAELGLDRVEIAALGAVLEIALDIVKDPRNLRTPITYMSASGPAGEKYEVCSGMRRYLAHILVGADNIRAVPVWFSNLPERFRTELRDNIERGDLADIEMILSLKLLQDHLDSPISVRRIKAMTGKSHGTAQQIRRILNEGTSDLFALMREGRFVSINAIITALDDPASFSQVPLMWFAQSFLHVDAGQQDRDFILLTLNDLITLLDSKLQIAQGCDEVLTEEIQACLEEMHLLFEQQRRAALLDQATLQYMVDRMMYCQRRCYDQIQNTVDMRLCQSA